jgi:hypothetical protein
LGSGFAAEIGYHRDESKEKTTPMDNKNRSLARYIIKVIAFIIFLILLFRFFGPEARAQSTQTVSGKVVDGKGVPLYLVHVKIEGTSVGDVTNEEGYFTLQSDLSEPFILLVSMLSYEKERLKLDPNSDQLTDLKVTLREDMISMEDLQVTGSAFTSGDSKGVTLSPIEVVTTPGSAADIFRAMKTFPGVAHVDEGSGLFVRGGDVSETKILLDQATVVHPYRFENPTGGVFGTIPPFMVSGTYFSTGGFPARYGNALSGVLAMESLDMPQQRSINANIGMAAASLGFNLPAASGKWGLRFTGNRSFTDFMFGVNGMGDEFITSPEGYDGNLSLIFQPKKGTTFKLFSFGNGNQLGVQVPEPGFTAEFTSEERNRLHNFQWVQTAGKWYGETSLSWNRFSNDQTLGGMIIDQGDNTWKLRTDWERSLSESLYLRVGAEWERLTNRFDGLVPAQQGQLNPEAEFIDINAEYTISRSAAWSEISYEFGGRWVADLGLRSDRLGETSEMVVDPRFTLSFKITPNQTVRYSTGIYHQFAEPFQFNSDSGNPKLGAQQSIHNILTYEFKSNLLHARSEFYHKRYDDLIIADQTQNLDNSGNGFAYGADFFLKYSEYLKTRFNGWISYSYLQSERFRGLEQFNGLRFDQAPSDFDITHNLTVVTKYQLIGFFTIGTTYRYATGRPVTPVTGSVQSGPNNLFQPIFGALNSERLPDFHRLDIDLSQYIPFGNGHSVVFYASISNALNRANVMDYSYSPDYSERTPVESNYRRFIYTGATISLSL